MIQMDTTFITGFLKHICITHYAHVEIKHVRKLNPHIHFVQWEHQCWGIVPKYEKKMTDYS